ncbi:MAG: hypothetical protein L0170_15045, partial [Acidobacteria bacterium]|nr:hypothetical protein [Acidobacteriota bacterium]
MGILDGLTELATFGGRSSSNLGRFTLDHPEFAPTVLKLPEDQDRGLVATLFGVPVGFQLGTALGLDGWTALGVDIATDPLTYLGIGAFLKGGRAARAPGRLVDAVAGAKGVSIAEKVGHVRGIAEKSATLAIEPWAVLDDLAATAKDKDDFLAKLFELKRSKQGRPVRRGGAPIEISKEQRELFEKSATASRQNMAVPQTETQDLLQGTRREAERLRSMQAAGAAKEGQFLSGALPADTDIAKLRNRVSRGGVEAGRAYIRNEIEKRKTIQTAIQQLSQVTGPEKFQLYADTAKKIRELRPPQGLSTLFSRQATRDMREYFKAYGEGRKIEPLGRSLEEQARKGQRALITLGLPFSERRLPLITGAPVFGAIDRSPGLKAIGQFFKASPYAGAAAKASTFLRKERPLAAFDTVYERALNYVDALRGFEPPPVPDAVNVAYAKYADERLVDDAGYALVQEFGAAIPKKEEQQLVYQMLDRPEKFLSDFPDAQGIFAMRTFAPSNLKAEWQGKITDDMLRVAEAMQQAFRGTKEVLTDQYDMINSAIQDYAPRIVTPLKKAEWQAKLDFIKTRQGLETQTSHLKKRLIPFLDDLFELEKKGIVKVEKDPMVVFREYFGGIGRAVASRRFVDRLASISVPFPDEATGIPLVVKDLDSLPKKAAELYTQTADPFLLKAASKASGAGYIPAGAWIHRDFAKAMRVLLEPPGPTTGSRGLRFHEKLFDWALTANALSKRMLLSFDLFSLVAMTEKAIALQGGTFLRNPAGFVSQGLEEIGRTGDMYKLAVKNGMDLRRNVDLEHEILGRAFKAADNWARTKRVPLVPAGVRSVRATLHAIDRP